MVMFFSFFYIVSEGTLDFADPSSHYVSPSPPPPMDDIEEEQIPQAPLVADESSGRIHCSSHSSVF